VVKDMIKVMKIAAFSAAAFVTFILILAALLELLLP
jgi:hypothetical protein